jgi:cytochrome b6-f complex iron-sulfur subunit
MEPKMTRREMMEAGALLVGGACCGCRTADAPAAARSTCCSTPDVEPESVTFGPGGLTIDLRKAPSLRGVGSAAYVVNKDKALELIVVHAGTNRYSVLSRLCTHGGQVVSFNRARGMLQCNNFNHSIFEVNGNVWKGPAEKPLKSYAVVLVADALVISI